MYGTLLLKISGRIYISIPVTFVDTFKIFTSDNGYSSLPLLLLLYVLYVVSKYECHAIQSVRRRLERECTTTARDTAGAVQQQSRGPVLSRLLNKCCVEWPFFSFKRRHVDLDCDVGSSRTQPEVRSVLYLYIYVLLRTLLFVRIGSTSRHMTYYSIAYDMYVQSLLGCCIEYRILSKCDPFTFSRLFRPFEGTTWSPRRDEKKK